MQAAGLDPLIVTYPTVQHGGTDFFETGQRIGNEIGVQSLPPTAVIAYCDTLALGLLHGLASQGVQIPRDLSVIGFDNTESSLMSRPSLTTIQSPLRKMGQSAASAILRCLNGIEGDDLVVFEPELVLRGSVGPCPS